MDYKEKYEQALERARGLLEGMDEGDYFASNEDIENIFPELKESEDERIRKALTEFLKSASGGFLNSAIECETFGEWLDWIEKQGKKKPTEDVKTLDADKVIEWLKPYGVLIDDFVNQFKKDFGLC